MSELELEAWKWVEKLQECQSKTEVQVLMTGCPRSIFFLIDEKPGLFGNYTKMNWFPWLRQLRNDPTSRFLEHLT